MVSKYVEFCTLTMIIASGPGKSWIFCHLNLVSTGRFVSFLNSLMHPSIDY